MNQDYSYSYSQNSSYRDFLTKVFSIVALGLAVSGVVSYFGLSIMISLLMSSAGLAVIIGSFILEIAIVIYMNTRIMKISKTTAYICFFIYAILNGMNLSIILIEYTFASCIYVFGITTLLFICMAIISHSTNLDLTKHGTLIFGGLITLVIASIVNIFLRSSMFEWIITIAGIIIFLVLVAFDMQKLRNIYNQTFTDSELSEKMGIIGALELYLDFINLFLRILRLFGNRRD